VAQALSPKLLLRKPHQRSRRRRSRQVPQVLALPKALLQGDRVLIQTKAMEIEIANRVRRPVEVGLKVLVVLEVIQLVRKKDRHVMWRRTFLILSHLSRAR